MHITFGQSGNSLYRQSASCGGPPCSCCSWRPRCLRSMRPVSEEDWGPLHHLQHHHDHQSDIKRFQYVSKLLSSCHQVIANTLLNTNMDIIINHDNKSGIGVFQQSESCKSRSELMTRQDNKWRRARKNDNGDFQLVTIPCICCSHVSYCSLACRQLAKGDLSFNFQPDYLFFYHHHHDNK